MCLLKTGACLILVNFNTNLPILGTEGACLIQVARLIEGPLWQVLLYYPGLCSRHLPSIVPNDSGSRQQRPWSDCSLIWAFAVPTFPKGTFLLGAAHMIKHKLTYLWTRGAENISVMYVSSTGLKFSNLKWWINVKMLTWKRNFQMMY